MFTPMIVQCPTCNARFMVADALIPPAGRTVRCGACSHQWHLASANPEEALAVPASMPLPDDLPSPEIAALSVGANVPAITRPPMSSRPFRLAVPVLVVVWAALAFITYANAGLHVPLVSALYRLVGAQSTEGLAFADVTMERTQEGSKTRFILTGTIINRSGEQRHVPTVRVMLKDKQGGAVWAREYPVNVDIKPGGSYPFRIANVETNFASTVVAIVLDVGTALQLMVR